jgi:hypothetical protein
MSDAKFANYNRKQRFNQENLLERRYLILFFFPPPSWIRGGRGVSEDAKVDSSSPSS